MLKTITARKAPRDPGHWPVFVHVLIPVFLGVLLAMWFRPGLAGEISLAWDPVADDRTGGYELHYGRAPGAYDTTIDVGNTTNHTVAGLEAGTTYYFAVRAYTADLSLWSDYSNEVSGAVAVTTEPAPIAAFSATPTSGYAPVTVAFQDASSGVIDGWNWDFGDGASSSAQSPSHTYAAAGTYSVSLTVTGPGGSTTETKSDYISVSPPVTDPVTADFSANPTSGAAPLTVVFTSASTADSILSYRWDFGDGTTSLGQTAVHTYASAGSYTVKLVVVALATDGSRIYLGETKPDCIVVSDPAPLPPVAAFTATNTTGEAPLEVHFEDVSDGSVEVWSWDFGDGSTSPLQNPTHTYSASGTYDVSLTVTDAQGLSDTLLKPEYVIVEAPAGDGPVAAYGFEESEDLWTLDASGHHNDGLIEGATRIEGGRFGRALAFDGFNDWVSVSDAASLDLTDGMTLEAWLHPTEAMVTWRCALFKEQTDHLVYSLYANTNEQGPGSAIDVGGEQILRGGAGLESYRWTHVAATYDGSAHRLYIDGTEVAQQTLSGAIRTSDGPLRIGGNSVWGEFFRGYVDEVRVYDRALSASEIQADMLTPVVDLGGSLTALLEVGEVALDHEWQTVALTQAFIDPVVVAKPLSHNGSDPAVVRVRNVDATGFEIRIQEWGYLNDWHPTETVSYLVMERGSHVLTDGTRVQADSIDTDATNAFESLAFAQTFAARPVVLTAITTVNDADAVTTRLRNVGTAGFELGMREQEKDDQMHAPETISYIAWEPSSGLVDGLEFEVGRTTDSVTAAAYTIDFQSAFVLPPALLADIQTTDGGDTANLRWANKSASSVEVWVGEEQSLDDETYHTSEEVGYILFSGF